MKHPSFIANYLDFLDEDNAHYPGSGELLSIVSAIGKKLGLKKMGIQYEGRLMASMFCKGETWDMDMFALVRTQS